MAYKTKLTIEINVKSESVAQTGGGSPTFFDFKDDEGTEYYFRLRNGAARIVCYDRFEGTTLAANRMEGKDGVCSWDDVVEWARKSDVIINMVDGDSDAES